MPIVSGARRLIWVATLCVASFAASAQRVEGDRVSAQGDFATEVAVNGQGEGQRNNAFARGLLQIFTRLTGDRAVTSRPGVGQELRRAREYVKGYDYRQDEGVSASGAPSFKTVLVIRYDEEKIRSSIETLGLPVWPQPRPKPVLWLAIDDGTGPRLVGLNRSNAARPALDQAIERGYRLGLPAGTAAEQALVGAIWRGDTAAIARASQRYSPPMQLVGKLFRDGKGGWQADWVFIDKGKVLNKWTTSEPDARRAIAGGASGAADVLVRRYAKPSEGSGPAGKYAVRFTGINSSDDYIRLIGYLQKQAVVRRVTPVNASPDAITLELDLVSGVGGLKRATAKGGVIAGEEGDEPVFRLR